MTQCIDDLSEQYSDFIKGTCMSMCPEKELLLREREKLLHPLELADGSLTNVIPSGNKILQYSKSNQSNKKKLYKADPAKTVKSFSRSAAGHKTPLPSDLRPAPVLIKTVAYLINQVAAVSLEEKTWVVRYQFVADRLRAVRQDMVIQNLPACESIAILEPIVRFHCYSAYRLCEDPVSDFDPKLNLTHLQECIKRLLVLYDSTSKSDKSKANQALKNQSEFEVLYTTLNLGDVSAITRALERNSDNKTEQLALELSISWHCGNYVRVCRLISSLPVLSICAVTTQLPSLRRQTLAVMTTAYSSKNLRLPVSYVRSLLKLSDCQRATRECRHYGLSVAKEEEEMYVSFLKGTFDNSASQSSCIPSVAEHLYLCCNASPSSAETWVSREWKQAAL